MTTVRLDFTGVETREPLPEDDYLARITASEVGVSKKGDPKWHLEFTVDLDGKERKAFLDLSLQEQAWWRVQAVLIALGHDPEEELSSSFDLNDLSYIGMECVIRVGQHEYEGNIYNDVIKVSAIA